MKKRVFVIVVVVAVAATVYLQKRYQKDTAGSQDGALKIFGTIDIRDASLRFLEQEKIAEILVEEGDHVIAGQSLARLRSDRLDAQIDETFARIEAQKEVVKRLEAGSRPQEIAQARAEVEAAEVSLANSRKVVDRLEKTVKSGATSVQDMDDARARLAVDTAQLKVRQKRLELVLEGPRAEDVATARSQLDALQAILAGLNIRKRDMTLVAPTSGVIQSRILEVGELAGPKQPVFTLALHDPKWVRAYVAEPDLGRVREGMEAKVISDSSPDREIAGRVGFISSVAEFTPRAIQTEELRTKLVYEVRILVSDEENRLRLGMPVTVVVGEDERSVAQAGDGA